MIICRHSHSLFLRLMIIIVSMIFTVISLAAGNNTEQNLARSALVSGEIISFTAVQMRVTQECQCQIVEAKLHREKKQDSGLLIYDIKAITPRGQIIKLEMDAHSGEIVHIKNKEWKK